MTQKGKEKQFIASSKTLILQVKETGRKIDEVEFDFNKLPNKFTFTTDIFSYSVLNDSHTDAVKKAKSLRELNSFVQKHM